MRHVGKPPKPGLIIFERDDFTCAYCIRVFDHVRLNMDHIFPAMHGGPAVAGNLITHPRDCSDVVLTFERPRPLSPQQIANLNKWLENEDDNLNHLFTSAVKGVPCVL